ncbi:MAG: JAB domain-containing protein [Verrucomicrobiae bacterium]|nr:JAB domain-containing protein [Verrucomicrobiae bacterium]
MIREIKILTLREIPDDYNTMSTPQGLAEFWRREIVPAPWYDSEKEQLVVVSLNTKLKVKTFNLVSIGVADQTSCHAREVFRSVILSAASYAIPMHNHPSGSVIPSAADLFAARQLIKAGKILGIPCLDFLIIGDASPNSPSGYFSLKQAGLVSFDAP